jgi:hypothetical protein
MFQFDVAQAEKCFNYFYFDVACATVMERPPQNHLQYAAVHDPTVLL